MINQKLSNHIKIMRKLHRGQTDKTGFPYWKHPLRVMYIAVKLCNPASLSLCLTALFHDVIEDVKNGNILLQKHLSICPTNIADNVYQSVTLLTKPRTQSYDDYMNKVLSSGNEIAIIVKHADIIDHWVRLSLISDSSVRERLQNKYEKYMTDISITYPKFRMIYPTF